jgi:hypothetical protein
MVTLHFILMSGIFIVLKKYLTMKRFNSFFKTLLIPIFIFGYSTLTDAQQASASGDPFSIIILPDAQNYTSSNGGLPATFTAQTQWCVSNQASRNIQYVGMVGDITNDNLTASWVNGNTSMSILDATLPGIPYGIALGNHDYTSGSTGYNTYFPVSRFTGRSYYGGHYGTTNEHHYDFISAGGMEFIVICLSFADQIPGTAILDWADALLKSNSGKRGILINHSILNPGIQGSFTSPGQAIYNALKDNPNLFLMVCGHVSGSGYRKDTYNGSTIYSMLADYQSEANGGNGWLRIAEFDPANDLIHMTTYSPTLNSWKTTANDKFDITYDMPSAIQPAPVAFNVTGSGYYCQGTGGLTVALSGSESGVTYTLYKGGIAQSPTVFGTGNAVSFGNQTAGTYTVIGTNSTGTTIMTGNAVVTENPGITISGTVTDAACNASNGAISISVTGGTLPVITWKWTGINGYTSTSQNISGLAAGTYTVTVTDTKSCPATKSFTVLSGTSTLFASVSTLNNGTIFRTSPTYTASSPVLYITGKSGNFGLSSQVKLTATATGGSGTYTYTWSPKTGLSATSGATVTAKPTVTTTYTVTVKDSKGCTSTQIQKVTVNKISCTSSWRAGVMMCILNTNGTRSSTCVLLTNTSVINKTSNLFGTCSAAVTSSFNQEFISAEPESSDANTSIKAYPNPTSGNMSLEITGFAEGKASIRLFCSDGSLAMKEDIELTGTVQVISLDLSNLANGVYLVQLLNRNGMLQTMIVKQ